MTPIDVTLQICRRWVLAFGLTVLAAGQGAAQDVPVDSSLGESIVFIKNNRLFPVDLETTIFRPEGAGPFPVVLINHGKETGNNRLQTRARYVAVAREFLQRGYAVVVPMRQGFSKSGGTAVGEGCNIAGNGEAQAEDVRAIVAWLEKQPWADPQKMVMLGQSHGGLTTLAYAQDPHSGFKLFVNFAGGLKWAQGGCPWEQALVDAYRQFGAKTRVASMWFYGENDSYFPPAVIQPAFDAYVKAGGRAEMVAFGPFGGDAHGMFGSYKGVPIWLNRIEAKLAKAGLPTSVVLPQYDSQFHSARLPATEFAKLSEVDRIPHLRDAGREGYRTYLARGVPRAFAVAPNGAWGWADGGESPFKRALAICNRRGEGKCRLYSVDEDVVWTPEGAQ